VSFVGAAAEHDPDVRDIEQVIDGVRWALVEYAPRAGRTEWCDSPHSGYMLNGELQYEFEDGSPELRVAGGQAFRLPAAPAHRGRNHGSQPARLFIIDALPAHPQLATELLGRDGVRPPLRHSRPTLRRIVDDWPTLTLVPVARAAAAR